MSGIRGQSTDRTVCYPSPHPVPCYLIAIAAGDLEFRPTGARTGVWALPQIVDAAQQEFSDMEAMVSAAEELYGPYDWGRFDALIMPPSFPLGGMENPRLTFVTSTLLVGDKSLVSTVAHELAHSWSGNKITNSTWLDLWLNEGLTVYAEHRLMESLYGQAIAQLHRAVDGQMLAENIKELGTQNQETCLCVPLAGKDPDDAFTYIPYHKGSAIWRRLEQLLTRPIFDQYLRDYIQTFAWKSISSTDWLSFWRTRLNTHQWLSLAALDWIYQPSIPESQPQEVAYPSSELLSLAMQQTELLTSDPAQLAASGLTKGWIPYQWISLIKSLPENTPAQTFSRIDRAFSLSTSENTEVCLAFCHRALLAKDLTAWAGAARPVGKTGRNKMVKPLYEAMYALDPKKALELYAKNRPTYHGSVVKTLDSFLAPQV